MSEFMAFLLLLLISFLGLAMWLLQKIVESHEQNIAALRQADNRLDVRISMLEEVEQGKAVARPDQ